MARPKKRSNRRPGKGRASSASTRRGRSRAAGRRAKATASRKKPARPPRRVMKKKRAAQKAKARRAAVRVKTRRAAVTKAAVTKAAVKKAAMKKAARKPEQARSAGIPRRPPLDRERRRLPDGERQEPMPAEPDARLLSSVRAGRGELKELLAHHTESSPTLTAGDVDARWDEAYAIGDEAPGGDNPTPDQNRVDDIGKALGVQYRTDEGLRGGDEITDRDRHRWELDPASSDDWPHEGTTKKPE